MIASFNQLVYLVQTQFAAVDHFQGGADSKAASNDRKAYGVEQRLKCLIKWAIDENSISPDNVSQVLLCSGILQFEKFGQASLYGSAKAFFLLRAHLFADR